MLFLICGGVFGKRVETGNWLKRGARVLDWVRIKKEKKLVSYTLTLVQSGSPLAADITVTFSLTLAGTSEGILASDKHRSYCNQHFKQIPGLMPAS
jgi:hypothetical protein